MGKAVKSVGKAVSKTVKSVVGGVADLGKGIVKGVSNVFKPKTPEVDVPEPAAPPAPPAPDAELTTTDAIRPENINRRKKGGRGSLRVDLNTGAAPVGTGVNVPRG